jgi:hypothetical protein
MKLNWGTSIVIAFISFMSFILFFIVRMNINAKYDHDLVSENYYADELKYQDDIDKLHNTTRLTENIYYKKVKGLKVYFPSTLEPEKITGKMFLYRPSNKQLDFETTISLSQPYLLIPDKRLVGGRWNIKIDWTYKGTSYLYKEAIFY